MATLDSSPSLFMGQSWEDWSSAVDKDAEDENDGVEADDKGKRESDSMKLRKEDMFLYGQCPARDEFYLVVCEYCNQVIKPQALQRHIKYRHGNIQACDSNASSRPQKARDAMPPKSHPGSSISQKADMHGKSPHKLANDRTLNKSASSGSLNKQEKANTAQHKRNHTNPVVMVDRLPASKNSSRRNNGHTRSKDKDPTVVEEEEQGEDRDAKVCSNNNETLFSEVGASVGNSNNNSAVMQTDDSLAAAASVPEEPADSCVKEEPCDLLERRLLSLKERTGSPLIATPVVPSPKAISSTPKGSPLAACSRVSRDSPTQARTATPPLTTAPPPQSPVTPLKVKDSLTTPAVPTVKSVASKQGSKLSSKSSSGTKGFSKLSPLVLSKSSSSSAPSTPVMEDKHSVKFGDSKATTASGTSSTTISPQGVIVTNATLTNYKKMQKEKNVPCKDRVYDPDKHCGVWINDTQRQCTRSLTCKTHALSLRRSVKGRSKTFDDLLKEHRAAKEIMLKEKADKTGTIVSQSPTGSCLTSPVTSPSAISPVTTVMSAQALSAVVTSPVMAGLKSPTHHHQHKLVPVTPVQRVQPKPALQKLLPSPHTRPTTLPIFPAKDEPIQLPETTSRLSSDGEDDDDDSFTEKPDYPFITHHPRPAAINNFGGWLHGRGCHVFNRKEDLVRSAIIATVERHLHPPPHKKLCVESKLPKGSTHSTNTKDPYEFTIGSDLHGAHSSNHSASNTSLAANRLASKPKGKPSPPTGPSIAPVSRPVKQKDSHGGKSPLPTTGVHGVMSPLPTTGVHGVKSPISTTVVHGVRSPLPTTGVHGVKSPLSTTGVLTTAMLGKVASSSPGGSATKRKRSGSSPGPGAPGGIGLTGVTQSVSSASSTNPLSIAIPSSCINLNLSQATLSNINAHVTTNKGTTQLVAGKNNVLKDLSIVVTNIDSSSILNGQLVSIPVTSGLGDNVTHIQLNSLADANKSAKVIKGSKPPSTSRHSSYTAKSTLLGSSGDLAGSVNALMTSIPVTPESALQSSVFAPGSFTMVSGPPLVSGHPASVTMASGHPLTMASGHPLTMVSGPLASVANGSMQSLTSPLPSPAPSPTSGFSSGLASPLVASPLPNGMTSSHSIKGFTNINHMATLGSTLASIPSPTDGLPTQLGTTFTLQTGKNITSSRASAKAKVNPQLQASPLCAAKAQQLAAAALNLNTPQGKLLSASNLGHVYQAPVLNAVTSGSPFASLHRQPKLSAKGGSSAQAKALAMQPMSLTIMAPSNVPNANTVTQPTHLVLQNDNSPSNLLS